MARRRTTSQTDAKHLQRDRSLNWSPRPTLHHRESKNLRRNIRSEIPCDRPEAFTELQEDFAKELKRQRKKGKSVFEITLEPDPEGESGVERGEVEEKGDEEEDVEFLRMIG